MGLLSIRYYPVGASDGYFFGVSAGYIKGGVGPSTINLTSHKVDCFFYGGYFVLSSIRYYSSVSQSYK